MTKSKRQQIIELHHEGYMVPEIVEKVKVDRSYVYGTLQHLGLASNANKATKIREDRIKELYYQDKSHKEIAKELGLHPNSISRIVRRIGLTPIRERKMEKLLAEVMS